MADCHADVAKTALHNIACRPTAGLSIREGARGARAGAFKADGPTARQVPPRAHPATTRADSAGAEAGGGAHRAACGIGAKATRTQDDRGAPNTATDHAETTDTPTHLRTHTHTHRRTQTGGGGRGGEGRGGPPAAFARRSGAGARRTQPTGNLRTLAARHNGDYGHP